MRYIKIIPIILFAFVLIISCKPEKKEKMTLTDYIKIENEIIESDMKPETQKKIIEDNGYTMAQFEDFEEKVENDPKLKEKLGELKLGEQD